MRQFPSRSSFVLFTFTEKREANIIQSRRSALSGPFDIDNLYLLSYHLNNLVAAWHISGSLQVT